MILIFLYLCFMKTEKEINNSWVLLFAILFFLFIIVFSDGSGNSNTRMINHLFQSEQYLRNPSGHINATLSVPVSLPEIYKNNTFSIVIPGLNLFSFHFNVAVYDNSSNQQYINLQKTRLVTDPLLLRRIIHSPPFSEKDDLPVLS
jgi:hypothetical protein